MRTIKPSGEDYFDATGVYDSSLMKNQQEVNAEAIASARHLPYPGTNGNWMTWDASTGAYVDSGEPSRGADGATGPQGPKGDKGDTGATGAAGAAGAKGDKGDKGDPGDPAPTSAVAPAVAAWLEENITVEEGVAIDASLTVEGAAADAKATGVLKTSLSNVEVDLYGPDPYIPLEDITKGYIDRDGTSSSNNSFRHGFANVSGLAQVTVDASNFADTTIINTCDNTKAVVRNIAWWANPGIFTISVEQNEAYVCVSAKTSDIETVTITKPVEPGLKQRTAELEETVGETAEKLDEASKLADISGDIPLPAFEQGVVYAENGMLKYANRTWSIRVKQGSGIPLRAGDVIRTTKYGIYELGGAYTEDGITYNPIFYVPYPYRAPVDGVYYITINLQSHAGTATTDILSDYQFFRPSSRSTAGPLRTFFDNYKIKSINHRGYNRVCPENTIPAFIMSAKMGFPIVETDLRFTSDGVPVFLHDATINRTGRNADGSAISGTVNIADITYAQALAYDFGIFAGQEFAGTKIPTLQDAVSVWKQLGIGAYVEIQHGTTPAQIKSAIDIVKAADYLGNITWISFDHCLLAAVSIFSPESRLGYLTENITSDKIVDLQTIKSKYNAVFIDANILELTSEYVTAMKNAEESLEVWTVNTESVIDGLDPYVSGVTSDNINAQEYCRNKLIGELPVS